MPGEFDLIARHFTRPVKRARLGVGDDCALFGCTPGHEWAITTDMLIAGRHFLPSDGPGTIGHKAMAVNLSDLAAMGAAPRYALLSIALPSDDERFLRGFAGGFFGLAQKFDVEVIGGDTTRGGLLTLSVTALGEIPVGEALRRDGARAGDDVWVSGTLGDAALALAHHQRVVELSTDEAVACFPRLYVPTPRIELGLALRGVATACIDVSDGFAADLGHILERSGVAAEVAFEALPLSAAAAAHQHEPAARDCILAGGDDYELVFTAPPDQRARVEAIAAALTLPLSRVGGIVAGAGLVVTHAGAAMALQHRGFDHFAGAVPRA